MSLKPKKFSELKFEQAELRKKMQKRQKEINCELPRYTYIVSEGTKTEPYYIEAIAQTINEKYRGFSTGRFIVVEGTGRNTKGLLEYARTNVDKVFPQAEVVWLMYDKDDFPLDNFDNTQYSAEGKTGTRQYRVAWSNECIELWFLLHFQDLSVNVGRERYRELLKEYCQYEKNMKTIFEILRDKTDVAIARAKRQYETYGNIAPSQMCPATRVYQLIEELQRYMQP
ncbi:MAG: RloB domain-containing protein [Lachnospiraceae bacterium]|nr:RloB domain-containing protein [Lachnospiraceae bacterium]